MIIKNKFWKKNTNIKRFFYKSILSKKMCIFVRLTQNSSIIFVFKK